MKFTLIFLNFYTLQIISSFAISTFMIDNEINYEKYQFNQFNKNIDDQYTRNKNAIKLNEIALNLPIISKTEILKYTDDTLKMKSNENERENYSYFDDNNKTELNQPKLDNSNNFWSDFIICMFCALMILATVIGNTLVILAVLIVKKLHTKDNANNYLIVSLAISDLLVGILVLPFALHVEIVHDNKYIFLYFYKIFYKITGKQSENHSKFVKN
jgi:hypothetical protein